MLIDAPSYESDSHEEQKGGRLHQAPKDTHLRFDLEDQSAGDIMDYVNAMM